MKTRQKLLNGEFNLNSDQRSRRHTPRERRAMIESNTARLRASLEEEHDMARHPKAGLLWNLAWEHGHGNGYSEVLSYYEDFVELLK